MSRNQLVIGMVSRFPENRISPAEASENLRQLERLQRQLTTNVQESLALEIGLLKLRL